MSKKDKLLSAYLKNMSDKELIKTTRDIYYESNIGEV